MGRRSLGASVQVCEEVVPFFGPGQVRLGGAGGPVAGVTLHATGGADALGEVAGHSRNCVARSREVEKTM